MLGSITVDGIFHSQSSWRSKRTPRDGSCVPKDLFHGLWSGNFDIKVKQRQAFDVRVRGRTKCATENFRLV